MYNKEKHFFFWKIRKIIINIKHHTIFVYVKFKYFFNFYLSIMYIHSIKLELRIVIFFLNEGGNSTFIMESYTKLLLSVIFDSIILFYFIFLLQSMIFYLLL